MDKTNFKMEQFDKAVLNETAAWWQMYLPQGNVIFGSSKAKMLGFPDEMFKHYKDFTNLVHPDDYEKIMQAMRDHIAGNAEFYETTYRIKNKDGEYLNFYDCGQITDKNGDKITVTGFVLKFQEGVDIFSQMKEFKELISSGKPSIIELVSRIK